MSATKLITYVCVRKGATPSSGNNDVEDCYLLKESPDKEKAEGVLRRAGFLLGSTVHPRPPENEPEEKSHVAFLTIQHLDDITKAHGDAGLYYYLPEASYDKTIQALEQAGFERMPGSRS